jgi:phage replication O-like protein O
MKHTQLPNELIEMLMSKSLNDSERRILLMLARQTFGYNKTSDNISNSQFAKKLGLSKKTVITTLARLSQVGITSLVKKGNINKACNEWLIDLSDWENKLVGIGSLVKYDRQKLVGITSHTKDSITKDNIHTHKISRKKSDTKKVISDDNLIRLQEFIASWNTTRGTKFKATEALHDNFNYWAAIYTQREMLDAIPKIKTDSFWDKIMTPEIFLRRRNPNRENVDHIGKFSNIQPAPIREGYTSYDELKAKGLIW